MANVVEKTYEVRRLQAKDLFTMVKILSAISSEIRDELKHVVNEKKEADSKVLGLMLVEAGLKHAEGDMQTLLADLVGMKRDEFEKEPFEAPIIVIEKVAEQEDLKVFFQKVRNLTTKFSGK